MTTAYVPCIPVWTASASLHASGGMLGSRQCSCLAAAPAQFEQTQEALGESRSGGLLGAFKEVPSSDEEVQEAARFAAEQLSSRSNSLSPFELKQARGHAASQQLCPSYAAGRRLAVSRRRHSFVLWLHAAHSEHASFRPAGGTDMMRAGTCDFNRWCRLRRR